MEMGMPFRRADKGTTPSGREMTLMRKLVLPPPYLTKCRLWRLGETCTAA